MKIKVNNVKLLKDRMRQYDKHEINRNDKQPQIKGIVSMGYGHYIDEHGVSQLQETIFEEEPNQVLLGGSNYVLSKILGVEPELRVEYLNNIMGIGTDGPPVTDIYPKENVVCLFCVGNAGCGSSYTDIKTVLQQHRQVPGMLPIRLTDERLTGLEKQKYWFEKQQQDGKWAYYLKTFKQLPIIKNLWKDAAQTDQDGSAVEENCHENTSPLGIEAFGEMVLELTKQDLREYYLVNEGIEHARFNSLGLCTGVQSTTADGTPEFKQVLAFSTLNFSNEMLHMNKDLTIIYRLYVS